IRRIARGSTDLGKRGAADDRPAAGRVADVLGECMRVAGAEEDGADEQRGRLGDVVGERARDQKFLHALILGAAGLIVKLDNKILVAFARNAHGATTYARSIRSSSVRSTARSGGASRPSAISMASPSTAQPITVDSAIMVASSSRPRAIGVPRVASRAVMP